MGETSLGTRTVGTTFWLRTLAPMLAVARRLRLGVRLGVLAALLLVPTGLLAQAFLSTTNSQIGFAQKERDGVAVLRPALNALTQTVAGKDVDLNELATAVRDRPDLGLDESLAAASSARTSATTATGRASLAEALAKLITAVGNNSNLILDPDLDSFYVMDSLVVQLPAALVSGSQAAIGPQGDNAADNVAAQAVLAGSIANAAASLNSDADTALKNTSMPDLESQLTGLRRTADTAQALQNQLSSTLDHPAATDPRALAVAAEAAVAPASTCLDALLEARVGQRNHQQQQIVTITAASLLLAVWFSVSVMVLTRSDATRAVTAVTALASGDLRAQDLPDGRDEFGELGRALTRAMSTLRSAVAAIGEHAVTLAASSEQLSSSSSSIATAAEQTTGQVDLASTATQSVHAHVDSLSAASTEFGASISEISQNASEAARVAASATELASKTTRTVDQLGRSSTEITDVIQLIRAVAQQTNLLALNATIEAARAGETGRGFAVVATEVKDLAQQTETATSDITNRISQLQSESMAAAAAISQIGTVIAQINEFQTSIAGAVEQQSATAGEISQRSAEAASNSAEISTTVESVADSARIVSDQASVSRTATRDLARLGAELKNLVSQFQI